jgi:hypothetical protein
MTSLALVPPGAPAPAPSTARLALVEHLARMAAAHGRAADLRQTWDRLQAEKDAEARARRVLQTQIDNEEAAMKAWAADPLGPMPQADVYARQANEECLANCKRIADNVRAAEPEHAERSTAVTREIAMLNAALPEHIGAVLLEDAANIREELDATIAKGNALTARLFGLHRQLTESGALQQSNDVPLSHDFAPTNSAVIAAQAEWTAYAERLAHNPEATMEN